MSNFIDDLLKEWSHRIEDGKPDPTDCYHVSILNQIMYEMDLPEDFIGEFIANMNMGNVCEVSYEETGSLPVYRRGFGFINHHDTDPPAPDMGDVGDMGGGDAGAVAGGDGGGAAAGGGDGMADNDDEDASDTDDAEADEEKD